MSSPFHSLALPRDCLVGTEGWSFSQTKGWPGDAIAELLTLPEAYAAWLDALPLSLRDTATAAGGVISILQAG
jgi:hypothetical protein